MDGYLGYNQTAIAPQDQQKITFTCLYGTFAFRRMPFNLCNTPATFQRCTMSIFSYMIEQTLEAFMDDFSVFKELYDDCMHNLESILKRHEDIGIKPKIRFVSQVPKTKSLQKYTFNLQQRE